MQFNLNHNQGGFIISTIFNSFLLLFGSYLEVFDRLETSWVSQQYGGKIVSVLMA